MPQNNPDRQLYVYLGLKTYMELSMLFECEIPNHQMNLGELKKKKRILTRRLSNHDFIVVRIR